MWENVPFFDRNEFLRWELWYRNRNTLFIAMRRPDSATWSSTSVKWQFSFIFLKLKMFTLPKSHFDFLYWEAKFSALTSGTKIDSYIRSKIKQFLIIYCIIYMFFLHCVLECLAHCGHIHFYQQTREISRKDSSRAIKTTTKKTA